MSFAFNKSVGLVIPACHVHQRALRSTRSLVIYAVDEKLCSKLNKNLVLVVLSPNFALFCFL